MAQAEVHEVVSVDKDKLFQTVIRYEDYPQFVDGCESVKVERKGTGRARVTYRVNMMKEVTYTLDLNEDPAAGVVHWSLVESDSFKVNNGRWEIKEAGPGKSDVTYRLEIEFTFPVPGFILSRLVKGQLPSMVKAFVERAKG